MKRIFNSILYMFAAAALLAGCDSTEPWNEVENLVVPGDDSYTVATAEFTTTSASGITTIVDGVMKHTIAFADADGKELGRLAVVISSDATTYGGTYTASDAQTAGTLMPESYTVSNDAKNYITTGTVEIAQNGLNSLTVTIDGTKITEFAKGDGVKAHSRAVNNDCSAKYLINHTAADAASGLNIHTLSIGAKGVSVTEGAFYDTYAGSGDYLVLKFTSSAATLGAGSYTIVPFGTLTDGTFQAGKLIDSGYGFSYLDGAQFYTLADGTATVSKAVTGGKIDIAVADAEKETFTLTALLLFEDGTIFTSAYTGRLTPEPAPARNWNIYKDVVTDVTVFDWNTFTSTVIPGIKTHTTTITAPNGDLLGQFVFILNESATSLAGTYPVEENIAAEGKMANGFDGTAYNIGITGSYFFDADGNQWLINAGSTVTITDNGDDSYTFAGQNVSVTKVADQSTATMNIDIKAYSEESTGPGSGSDALTLNISTGLTYTKTDNTATATVDSNNTPLTGATLYTVAVNDASGLVATFDFVTAEGATSLAGTYSVMSYPNAAGKAGNGWSIAAFNMGGGCQIIVGGTKYMIPVDATITVTDEAGVLSISMSGTVTDEGVIDMTTYQTTYTEFQATVALSNINPA